MVASSTEGLSAGTIEAANADVTKAFGFNPLTDEPRFEDRGTKPVNAAGLWLAAVSTLANDNTNAKALGCDVSPLVTVGARVNWVVSAMGKQGLSDDSLLSKLDAAKKKAKADERYAQAEPQAPKSIKMPLMSAAGATGIGNAKVFVASIRNTVPAYKALQKEGRGCGRLVEQRHHACLGQPACHRCKRCSRCSVSSMPTRIGSVVRCRVQCRLTS